MEKRENFGAVPKNEVLMAALKTKETMATMGHQVTNYGCHTPSPYSDGFGDVSYGDYEDAV